jgi:hypothetical protein
VDEIAVFSALADLAEEVGVAIRRAPPLGGSQHPGGALVRLKGSEVLFLDPTASTTEQIDVLADALRGRPELENRYLRPDLRELLEEHRR